MSVGVAIGRRRRWGSSQQAKINWGHPLAAGLTFCGVNRGLNIVDLVGTAYVTSRITSPTSASTAWGEGLTGGWVYGGANGLVYPSFTLSAFGQLDSISAAAQDKNIIKKNVTGTDYILRSHNTLGWLYYTNRSGSLVACNSTTGFALGQFALSVTDTSGAQEMFVNRARTATASASGSSFAGSEPLTIGDQQAGGEKFVGAISLVTVHQRVLSANEIATFHADPFCMLTF